MASSIGLIDGFNSTIFAFTTCFALVVMFDAAGLRRNASRQAHVLNRIIKEFFTHESSLSTEKLKEFLGHTPSEVIVGGLLGVAVSLALHHFL
jgi:acid phosphatase family membrane protein YuiD